MAAIRLLARWLSPRHSPGPGRARAGTWDTPERACSARHPPDRAVTPLDDCFAAHVLTNVDVQLFSPELSSLPAGRWSVGSSSLGNPFAGRRRSGMGERAGPCAASRNRASKRSSRAGRLPTGFGRAAGTRQGRGAVGQASVPVVYESRPARVRAGWRHEGRGPGGCGRCSPGPCLCAVLALVTPAAAADAPAPDVPDWLAARLRATTARPAGDRPAWVARYEYRGGTVYYFPRAAVTSRASSTTPPATSFCAVPTAASSTATSAARTSSRGRRGGEIVWSSERGRSGPFTPDPGRVSSPAIPMIGFAPCARSTVVRQGHRRAARHRSRGGAGHSRADPGGLNLSSASPVNPGRKPACSLGLYT